MKRFPTQHRDLVLTQSSSKGAKSLMQGSTLLFVSFFFLSDNLSSALKSFNQKTARGLGASLVSRLQGTWNLRTGVCVCIHEIHRQGYSERVLQTPGLARLGGDARGRDRVASDSQTC